MRIWSLHPKYLDSKGLVALWREGLLALEVLRGNTSGYKYHPQLIRFKKAKRPVQIMKKYLFYVYEEASIRGYSFDKKKIGSSTSIDKITVTKGQLLFEYKHLQNKLRKRNYQKYKENKIIVKLKVNPILRIVNGEKEEWEK